MPDPAQALKLIEKKHEYLVGIDSDGCVFDTMEIKQKECFIPNIILYWNLQPIAKYVRETVEFVNLYSKWRGVNRWPALLMVFDLLAEREEVIERKVRVPEMKALRNWVANETKLSNPVLKSVVDKTGDKELEHALAWSTKVNETIAEMVHDIPPFPHVQECLAKLSTVADMIVVSQTPCEALTREWQEHGIDKYVHVIAGQEMGSKAEHLSYAMDGRWTKDRVLMIGDALGDLKAAHTNEVMFNPINPGKEDGSWRRFSSEGFDRFRQGTFLGDYMNGLIDEFKGYLPEVPPWKEGA
jgi:phosphoglycolate phosphatase-like HAD superfamily hydrolase